MAPVKSPIVLFGYDSSTFTAKVRLVLRLKQIPYVFVRVPSMMPRAILKDAFNLTYRKIPVLAIGRDIYCDTSLIIEALEEFFSEGYASIYPPAEDGCTYRAIMRGLASYWTDRALFRVTTGLIPSSVWRSGFGNDRAGLIGHQIDADKLEKKLPANLVAYDLQCSLFEAHLRECDGPWLFSTRIPSLADISLFYQLRWGNDIAAGRGIQDLTGGELSDTNTEGSSTIFNQERHPALLNWYKNFEGFLNSLPVTETVAKRGSDVIDLIEKSELSAKPRTISTPNAVHIDLSEKVNLVLGARVSVAPDDTGRDCPTLGRLASLSPEEVVILSDQVQPAAARMETYIHFPCIGFVVRPLREEKL